MDSELGRSEIGESPDLSVKVRLVGKTAPDCRFDRRRSVAQHGRGPFEPDQASGPFRRETDLGFEA